MSLWFAMHRHSVQNMSSCQCSMYILTGCCWFYQIQLFAQFFILSLQWQYACNAGHMTLCLHCYILQLVYTYQFHLFRFYITPSNSYTCAKSVYQKRHLIMHVSLCNRSCMNHLNGCTSFVVNIIVIEKYHPLDKCTTISVYSNVAKLELIMQCGVEVMQD